MYKIVALIGESGSGKDTMMNRILARGQYLHKIVSCTTRPKREKETEGKDYFFYSPKEFGEKVLNDEMLEATSFNNWFYGTSCDSVVKKGINIGVFNPSGIEFLLNRKDIDLKIFYIFANPKVRLLRQLNREACPDVDEIVRRYVADKSDFSNLKDSLKKVEYKTILNEDIYDLNEGVDYILDELQDWCGIKGELD